MLRALYSAASGMSAQQMNVDNIAHNLANANTTGYKVRRAQFQDLLYQTVVQPGSRIRTADRCAHRLADRAGHALLLQRDPVYAGSVLADRQPAGRRDSGEGFLPGAQAHGELAYTRAGTFHLDRDGNVVTSDGNPIEPAITIPANALQISIGQGRHRQLLAAQSNRRTAGRPDSTRQLPQSRGPQQHGRQSL